MNKDNKTYYLNNLLFGLIQWGNKREGEWLSSEEVASRLKKIGFESIDSMHIGIYLNRQKYLKRTDMATRDCDKNLKHGEEPSGYAKRLRRFFVKFINISEKDLNYKLEKYNPFLKEYWYKTYTLPCENFKLEMKAKGLLK